MSLENGKLTSLTTSLYCFGFSTLERWYYQVRDAADPVAALGRKIRRDAGKRQALSGALVDSHIIRTYLS
ncbi:MAG: hypothetical protein P1P74_12025 [Desulfuromonadales bacterium]|nr:hypothetical protein [Desulfuromonadales bacterium]